MGLAFFLSAAVFALRLARRSSETSRARRATRRRWMLASWAACALAVLSKGLIGIVLPLRRVGAVHPRAARLGAAAPAAARRAAACCSSPSPRPGSSRSRCAIAEFAHFFFIQEHFQRFTTTMHHRYAARLVFPAGARVRRSRPGCWSCRCLAGRRCSAHRGRAMSSRGAVPRRSGRWCVRVLLGLGLQAARLHPADVPGARAADRRAAGARRSQRRLLVAQAVLAGCWAASLLGVSQPRCDSPAGALDLAPGARLRALARRGGAARARGAALAAALAAWRGRPRRSGGAAAVGASACSLTVGIVGHRALAPAYSVGDAIAALPRPPARTRASTRSTPTITPCRGTCAAP